jgi:hypothetical protein
MTDLSKTSWKAFSLPRQPFSSRFCAETADLLAGFVAGAVFGMVFFRGDAVRPSGAVEIRFIDVLGATVFSSPEKRCRRTPQVL